ncbi:LOW QUALITY PROTEIN: DNA-binding protein RFX8 [Pezoporus flaviventris]|uniref:LOW QUALITY PROTEIN: DNA-binding protein RFX8 n=1 Tax=Pezoporus flaviventris TaxID=889875 RepID=UPI002AAFFD0F|nr:LOW QUALITY PROTEIN: DNA-binding protein RFX8 [Pezoporus flaviventris]
MSQGSPTSLLHLSIIHWIADNFYLCEGSTIPRWLLYELYVESCSPYFKRQVNSATFGKLIRLVFPGLGTRRLGTRGSTRYHYDGIAIKKDSSFYASYCTLLSEKNYHRYHSPCKASSSAWQPSTSAGTSGDTRSYGDEPGYMSQRTRTIEQERFQYLWPESSRFCLWEQPELAKKYPYEMVVLLANEYYNHCQVILHMVRTRELDKVEGCIMSFWKSLPPGKIALMSLPDVCQLLESYDRQLFKEMENILLHDFLEEVPLQHIKSIRLFSKNIELWMVNALEHFPLQLQTSKSKEVTVFIKRLRRKTDLANMVKTVRTVLNSHSKVTVLRSDLHAVIEQGFLDIPGNLVQKAFRSPEEPQNDIELKCLNDFVSLLTPSTDIRVLLNCVSSNLHAFVIQPSRNKEEYRELASDFHLRWSFLLRTISKAMTLSNTDSFGSWHLLNLLLMDFVAHIFLSYIEEKEDESFWVAKQNEFPVLWYYEPSYLWGCFAEEQCQASTLQPAFTTSMQSQNNFGKSHVFQSSEMFGGHSHWQQAHAGHFERENY